MKIHKPMALAVVFLLLLGFCSGCDSNPTTDISVPEDAVSGSIPEEDIDISSEMVPLTDAPAMFTIPVAAASGQSVKKNEKAEIDYSNVKDGYIMVKYLQKTDKRLYVQITGPGGATYQYTLKSNGDYEVYPLSDGNGSYKINVLERLEGNKAAVVVSVKADVRLTDEFAPFIRPNQYVYYSKTSKTSKKASELIEGESNVLKRISVIYGYVIKNISYDKEKAAKIRDGSISVYLPDVDEILKSGKGICFDYAAVMAAMLRSQGIPCKLVVGYAGDAYHAWINAYSDETGWINNIIYFDGKNWRLMDPTYASSGGQSSEIMKYIGEGSNYKVKYLY